MKNRGIRMSLEIKDMTEGELKAFCQSQKECIERLHAENQNLRDQIDYRIRQLQFKKDTIDNLEIEKIALQISVEKLQKEIQTQEIDKVFQPGLNKQSSPSTRSKRMANYLHKAVLDSATPSPAFNLDRLIGGNYAEKRDATLAVVLKAGAGNFTLNFEVGVQDDDGTVTWVTHLEMKQGRLDNTNTFQYIPGALYRFRRAAGSVDITIFII